MAGERLGSGYVLIERIGRGAMGEVWRADGPDGPVAIKVLRPELADDPATVGRFLQERAILLSLHSPHLVAVRDLVVEGDRLAIVMDLVDGSDLRRLLDDGDGVTTATAVAIARQVAQTLGVAHAAGVVHRDIKPENVLLEPGSEPDVRVVDFGVARIAAGDAAGGLTRIVGTPRYMAPEVARGGAVGPGADVYAVGTVLAEMLGAVVVSADELPERPDGVPRPLWRIVRSCLATEPGARPSAAVLDRRLARFERRHPRTGSGTARRRYGRRPALVAAAAAVVSALVAGLVIWSNRHDASSAAPTPCSAGVKVSSSPPPLATDELVEVVEGGRVTHAGMLYGPVFIGFPGGDEPAVLAAFDERVRNATVHLVPLGTYLRYERRPPDGAVFREWAPRPGESVARVYVGVGGGFVRVGAPRRLGSGAAHATVVPRNVLDRPSAARPADGTLVRFEGSATVWRVVGRNAMVAVPPSEVCRRATVVSLPRDPEAIAQLRGVTR